MVIKYQSLHHIGLIRNFATKGLRFVVKHGLDENTVLSEMVDESIVTTTFTTITG